MSHQSREGEGVWKTAARAGLLGVTAHMPFVPVPPKYPWAIARGLPSPPVTDPDQDPPPPHRGPGGCPPGRLRPMARAVALLRVDATRGSGTETVGTTDRRCGGGGMRVGRARGGERPMDAVACGRKVLEGRAAASGERPMGAPDCRQHHNRASCQPPPPPSPLPQVCIFCSTVCLFFNPSHSI